MTERQQYTGVITRYFPEGGYGFIFSEQVTNGRDGRIFFHISGWRHLTQPALNDEVTFEVGPSTRPGKPDQAFNVTPINRDAKIQGGLDALAGGLDALAGTLSAPQPPSPNDEVTR